MWHFLVEHGWCTEVDQQILDSSFGMCPTIRSSFRIESRTHKSRSVPTAGHCVSTSPQLIKCHLNLSAIPSGRVFISFISFKCKRQVLLQFIFLALELQQKRYFLYSYKNVKKVWFIKVGEVSSSQIGTL